MVDDKNTPSDKEGTQKPSDEVTLDINSFEDDDIFESSDLEPDDEETPEAMDDFSFLEDDEPVNESPEGATPEHGVDIAADITDSYQENEKEKEQEKELEFEQNLFDEGHDKDLSSDIPSEGVESLPNLDDDELFADIFEPTSEEDDIFAQFKEEQPLFGKESGAGASAEYERVSAVSAFEDEPQDIMQDEDTTFSSDAFDDVNADFPEAENRQDLGDDQLFDYDASSTEAVDAEVGEDIFAAAQKESKPSANSSFAKKLEDMVSAGTAMFNKAKVGAPAGDSKSSDVKTKRIVRTAALLILVVFVYSILRFINPGEQQPVVASNNNDVDKIAKMDFDQAQVVSDADIKDTAVKITPPSEGSSEGAPAVASATEAQPAAPTATMPEPVVAAAPIAEPAEVAAPVTQAAAPPTAPTPETSIMAAPIATAQTTANTMVMSAEDKVAQLEAAISTMDQRLAALNAQAQPGLTGMSDIVPADPNAPRTQQILAQALQRIDDLDKKLSLLADLQKELKYLNTQVQALKSDIIQQSMIVGQSQREINTAAQVFKMDNPEPVRIMVQAAIPGRAWLRSESGELYTVIPGDEVPGYGKVVSIDAGTGTVIMSSRAVIREQF